MPEETPKSSEQLQQDSPQQSVQHTAPATGDPVSVAGNVTGGEAGAAPAAPVAPSGRGGERGGAGGGRGGRGGGDGRGRGGPRRDRHQRGEGEEGGIESAVVRIYRCSKVVKG